MNKFKDIARKSLRGNALGNLEKIKIDDLIAKYPDRISVTGVILVEYADTSYPAFTFAEDPTKYFTGGMALRKLVNDWLEEDPTLAEVNAELKADPLEIRMQKIRTKSGNTFTQVDILDNEPAADPETGEIIDSEPF